MLTARQTLLHYLSLIGILISLLQVFVFYFLTNIIWISAACVLFTFLFIIVSILNAGRYHDLAKVLFFTLTTSSLIVWALFLPHRVEVSIYFIPLTLMLIRLYDITKMTLGLRFSLLICIVGLFVNFQFESAFYKNVNLHINFLLINHITLVLSFIIVLGITMSIIKETKKEDEALFETKEKLMAIYDNLTNPMIFINRNFEVHWFNKNAEVEFKQFFNLDIKKGKKIEALFSEEYVPKYKQSYDLAVRGKIVKNEHVYVQNNLSKMYYEYEYIPVFDKFNEVIGVVLQMMNTTKRSTIENELTQQKMMLEEVYNQSPDALFLVSLKTEKIIYYNNTAKELFALDDDSSFISYKQLFKVEDKNNFWKKIDTQLIKQDSVVFEETNKRENNELFIGETRIKKFEINGIVHLLVRISDITDKVAQRELKFSILEMERQNAENLLRHKNLGMMIQGQEEERQRISKDLHDGIGQMLTAIRLEISAIENSDFNELSNETKVAKEMIDNTIKEVKRISNNLMPSAIVDLGLIPALKTLFKIPDNQIQINFDFDTFIQEIELSKKQEITIYRVIQEALNNALKYANATLISVKVNFLDVNHLRVHFSDNGVGFVVNNVIFKNSNGLINMKERASLINATFKVKSKINNGTSIEMILPLNLETILERNS